MSKSQYMDLLGAILEVSAGHAQRICAPGKWKVWRDGKAVRHEVLRSRA